MKPVKGCIDFDAGQYCGITFQVIAGKREERFVGGRQAPAGASYEWPGFAVGLLRLKQLFLHGRLRWRLGGKNFFLEKPETGFLLSAVPSDIPPYFRPCIAQDEWLGFSMREDRRHSLVPSCCDKRSMLVHMPLKYCFTPSWISEALASDLIDCFETTVSSHPLPPFLQNIAPMSDTAKRIASLR